MKKVLFAALAAFMAHAPANAVSSAAFETGNTFLTRSIDVQTAFTAGAADAAGALRPGRMCLPDHVTAKQLAAVGKKYLNEHPEELHMSAWSLIVFSLRAAFPYN